MKTILSITLLLIVAFSACKKEDFLDRFPQDAISEPTYFKNENDLKLYINQFYDSLPVQSPSFQSAYNDFNSDNFAPAAIDQFLASQLTVPASGGGWSPASWAQIRNVNYFLQRYNRAEADATIKAAYAGEARFFRALFYWQKVKLFGAVPWLSKDLTDTSVTQLYGPRQPHTVIMDSVLADLNFAVANAAEATNTQFAGRITKDVAQALKARICLWEGTYRKYWGFDGNQTWLREAVTASEALINSGRYAIYKTGNPSTDYYNLFIQEELKGNKAKQQQELNDYLLGLEVE